MPTRRVAVLVSPELAAAVSDVSVLELSVEAALSTRLEAEVVADLTEVPVEMIAERAYVAVIDQLRAGRGSTVSLLVACEAPGSVATQIALQRCFRALAERKVTVLWAAEERLTEAARALAATAAAAYTWSDLIKTAVAVAPPTPPPKPSSPPPRVPLQRASTDGRRSLTVDTIVAAVKAMREQSLQPTEEAVRFQAAELLGGASIDDDEWAARVRRGVADGRLGGRVPGLLLLPGVPLWRWGASVASAAAATNGERPAAKQAPRAEETAAAPPAAAAAAAAAATPRPPGDNDVDAVLKTQLEQLDKLRQASGLSRWEHRRLRGELLARSAQAAGEEALPPARGWRAVGRTLRGMWGDQAPGRAAHARGTSAPPAE